MAFLIHATGETKDVSPATPPHFTLEELQQIVGGWIEILYLHDGTGKLMIINEEGKLQNLPRNATATHVASERLMEGDYIVGEAIVVSPEEME